MRFARRLALLAAMAMAALAMTASSASAVEVTEEGVGHCTAVQPATHDEGSGGCEITAQSEGNDVELGSPIGMIVCSNDFEARVDESGSGYIYSQLLENCDPTQVEPCTEGEETENWPVSLTSTTTLEAQFCIDIPAVGIMDVNCHLPNIAVNQTSHSNVEFMAGPGGGTHAECEEIGYSVAGHWTATSDASHPEVEISQ